MPGECPSARRRAFSRRPHTPYFSLYSPSKGLEFSQASRKHHSSVCIRRLHSSSPHRQLAVVFAHGKIQLDLPVAKHLSFLFRPPLPTNYLIHSPPPFRHCSMTPCDIPSPAKATAQSDGERGRRRRPRSHELNSADAGCAPKNARIRLTPLAVAGPVAAPYSHVCADRRIKNVFENKPSPEYPTALLAGRVILAVRARAPAGGRRRELMSTNRTRLRLGFR